MVKLPGLDRLMSQSHHTLNAEPMQYTMFTRVFGATDSAQLKVKLETSWKELLKPIEDMFLNDAAAITALQRADIPEKASAFVTFETHHQKLRRWEQCANAHVVQSGAAGCPSAVEADLQSLARDFGACVAIPQLYGRDFLNRNKNILKDFWKFDNEGFPLFIIGFPTWTPLRMVREGNAARSRLLEAMDALYRRIDQYQSGQAVDFAADMSDISRTALERNSVYKRRGWSFRERAGGDLAILWGQNANTQPIFFWLLTFVYSTPGLVTQLREEVEPFVSLSKERPMSIVSMDLPALFKGCPRLKSCIFETYRLTNEATSIRYVVQPITVQDGKHSHELKPGMFVSAPHAVTQRDPGIYAEPDRFVPERFLITDHETGILRARYGALKPWGVGAAMCKGRSFAEKEIIALSAAIISLWDIEPAEGCWKIPTMIPGTGVKKPIKDVRVRITRRSIF